jgi:hypothetical protein
MPSKLKPTALASSTTVTKRKAAAAALKTVGEYLANNSPAPSKKYLMKPFHLDVHDEGIVIGTTPRMASTSPRWRCTSMVCFPQMTAR